MHNYYYYCVLNCKKKKVTNCEIHSLRGDDIIILWCHHSVVSIGSPAVLLSSSSELWLLLVLDEL